MSAEQPERIGSSGMGSALSAMHIAGLDLGQTSDPSAFCLNTRYDITVPALPLKPEQPKEGHSLDDLKPVSVFPKKPEPGSLTASQDFYRAGEMAFDDGMLPEQKLPDKPVLQMLRHYACRALKRWPLGTSYVDIVEDIRRLDKRLDGLVLVVDNTGVGRPVVDMFRKARLRCKVVPITITGGRVVVEKPESFEWHVPKVELISTMQAVLQTRRIKFVEGQPEAATLIEELREYQVKVTAAANESFNAREGKHDDIVLAAALSLWWGERAIQRLRVW